MIRLWLVRLSFLLVIVGALNWGLVGLFKYDLVAEIVGEKFGTTNVASRIIYTAVGAAALILLATRATEHRAEPLSASPAVAVR